MFEFSRAFSYGKEFTKSILKSLLMVMDTLSIHYLRLPIKKNAIFRGSRNVIEHVIVQDAELLA